MDKPPKLDPRLLEAIDACRPGSDDLLDAELASLADAMAVDPELRAVYDKLEQTDLALAEAFYDVRVPEGLADRILDRLASADEAPASLEEPSTTQDETVDLPSPPAGRARFWRRKRILVTVVGATAASLLAALWVWSGSREDWTEGEVANAAVVLFDDEGSPPPMGILTSQESPPNSHPICLLVNRFQETRWRWTTGLLGRKAVAYDLTPAGGARATLYVVKYIVPSLPTSAPQYPVFNSRNRCAAAWQSGGLVYVLVVEGDARRYREILNMSSGRPILADNRPPILYTPENAPATVAIAKSTNPNCSALVGFPDAAAMISSKIRPATS